MLQEHTAKKKKAKIQKDEEKGKTRNTKRYASQSQIKSKTKATRTNGKSGTPPKENEMKRGGDSSCQGPPFVTESRVLFGYQSSVSHKKGRSCRNFKSFFIDQSRFLMLGIYCALKIFILSSRSAGHIATRCSGVSGSVPHRRQFISLVSPVIRLSCLLRKAWPVTH